ncbi:MAG TPA: hypothetical protein PLR20_14265 [Syntrophales bacterium]|nr:hypothetical protein [Syntrophales bacterium]HOX94033.1 hypothetical protein [Syntrophales bacterium]HPI58315.1 hypothetical protein [Syntrophales bacterium]HPN26133.1 hypothetical protein [Syntrophales bacterium]HQM30510.1 hypothetical protein [Syntrophales bacterium]
MKKSLGLAGLAAGVCWVIILVMIPAAGSATGQSCEVVPGGVVKEYHKGDDGAVQAWTEREYDDRGRRIRETRKDLSGKVVRSRELTYDGAGRVTKSVDKDAKGNVVFLQERMYNDGGKLVKDYTEESGRVTLWTEYAYNEEGNVTTETNRGQAGQFIRSFEYDTGWSLKKDVKDADSFKAFYIQFKSSKKFQRDHTRFPLEITIYRDGEGAETAQRRNISRKEWKFTDFNPRDWDIAIVKTAQDSPGDGTLRLKGRDNRVLVHYKFRKINEKWYLVRIEDFSS